jgi:hypothetical protein
MNYQEFKKMRGITTPAVPGKKGRKPETETVPESSSEQTVPGDPAIPGRKGRKPKAAIAGNPEKAE